MKENVGTLSDKFLAIYEGGQHEKLAKDGEKKWRYLAEQRKDPKTAYCCHLVMTSYVAMKEYARAEVWRARALGSSLLSGVPNVGLALMIPMAFRAFLNGDDEAALQTLDEMSFLLKEFPATEDGPPTRQLLWGLCLEKKSYALLRTGRYAMARTEYGNAMKYIEPQSRRWYKVSFGQVLARFLASRSSERVAALARSMHVRLMEEFRLSGSTDSWLLTQAEHNLKYMNGKKKEWVAYEHL